MNRKLTWVAVVLSVSIHINAQSQTFLGSKVNLSTEINDSLVLVTNEDAIITIKDADNSFTAKVSLFPIVNNPDGEDSLANENDLLQLVFNGKFPIENFSFYFDKNDDKSYSMNGILTMNGISKPFILPFTVRTPRKAAPLDENFVVSVDDSYYAARISFVISINPADFDLDTEPIAFKKNVILEIVDGIINKLY